MTVKCDCDLSAHLSDIGQQLINRPEDKEALREFFTRMGFRTWLREINTDRQASAAAAQSAEGDAQGGLFPADALPEAPAEVHYETVLTEVQLKHWLEKIDAAALTAVDTETTSLEAMRASMVGISLCVEPGSAAYIPLAHNYPGAPDQLAREQVLEMLRPWLENPAKPKLGQHLKYDSHIFANHGVSLQGIVHDTLLQSYVLESHRNHDMDSLALRWLDKKTISYQDVCGKGASQIGFDEVSIERATEYAAEDADITLRLHQAMWPRIEANEKLRFIYEDIEIPTARVLQRIERNGVLIDTGLLEAQSTELGTRLMALEQQAHGLAGQPFNLNSPSSSAKFFSISWACLS